MNWRANFQCKTYQRNLIRQLIRVKRIEFFSCGINCDEYKCIISRSITVLKYTWCNGFSSE